VLLAYSDKVVLDHRMRVTCCVHALPGAWEVEGLQNSAGSCLDWLCGIINAGKMFDDRFLERVSQAGPGSGGMIFYPYLAGASAPHWNPKASAVMLGLSFGRDKAMLARSVMEGVALQAKEIVDIFYSLKLPVNRICLTGGGSEIKVWNQMQADIYGKRVYTLKNAQATVLGAGILAAFGAGLFGSVKSAAKKMVRTKGVYVPQRSNTALYKKVFKAFADVYTIFEKQKIFDMMPIT
jgi:xylulokinase